MVIHLDFESRATVNLRTVGVYAYAMHPDTEILCAAYAIDDEPVRLWRTGEPAPTTLMDCATTGNAEIHAWNANFERIMWRHCWARQGGPVFFFPCPTLERWHCTMARGGLHGLPLDLDLAAMALGLSERKDKAGHALMMQMSKPRKKGTVPPVWWDEPEKHQRLGEYCMQDVVVEREMGKRLHPMPVKERKLYLLDQMINDRGMRLDKPLAAAALSIATVASDQANDDMARITEGVVKRTNQVTALLGWLHSRGCHVDDLTADTVQTVLTMEPAGPVRDALVVRQDAARSSVKKLGTMLQYAQIDERMRGMLQYAGAATGRWSGRGVQPQNFPRGTGLETEAAIPLVMTGDVSYIDWYAAPLELLSCMLRGLLIPAPGHTLMAGDYAAIEARVLAWVANQADLLDMFRKGVDPYKAMASKIYDTPMDRVTKAQRALGKTAILGLGYQMGWPTFQKRCALSGITISNDFASSVVHVYRKANYRIVDLWDGLERTAREAVRFPGTRNAFRTIVFIMRGEWLEMILPSGRSLYYHNAHLKMVKTPWDEMREQVVCNTFNSTINKWAERSMYGGLWTENAVQAIARDILADSMLLLEDSGFPLVLTVHDEIVAEVPQSDAGRLGEFIGLMSREPKWADGCPIGVEAWEGQRYRK